MCDLDSFTIDYGQKIDETKGDTTENYIEGIVSWRRC